MEKRIEYMKETLMSAIENQLGHIDTVDAKELGEVVDMVKDLEEALYYCTITKAMKKKEENGNGNGNGYMPEERMYYWDRDIDRPYYNRMYYGGGNGSSTGSSGGSGNGGASNSSSGGSSRYYSGNDSSYMERPYPMSEGRDSREGRSGSSRKMYMETKQMHGDKMTNLKELEHYMKDLSEDVTEMIADASPEEKQLLQRKLTSLVNKISQVD